MAYLDDDGLEGCCNWCCEECAERSCSESCEPEWLHDCVRIIIVFVLTLMAMWVFKIVMLVEVGFQFSWRLSLGVAL